MEDDVLTDALRATPFALFLFDGSDGMVFENARASELAELPTESNGADATATMTVRQLVVETVHRARRGTGSATADGAVVEADQTRWLRIEAQQLVLECGLATVAWAVELDRTVELIDEARTRIDELVDAADRRTQERERLVGVVEAMVSGLDAGLLVVDRSMTVIDCSDRAGVLLGVSPARTVGRALTTLGPAAAELAGILVSCFESRPSNGVLAEAQPPVHAGCASFDAGAAAVAVLRAL